MLRVTGVALLALVAVTGVVDGADGEKKQAEPASAFTLGVVQKQLHAGLSQADVVERLGSPNILTRDSAGREVWVYDRVSSEVEVAKAGVSVGGVGSGAGGTLAGLIGIGGGKSREKLRSSQRTLTVIVRFSAALEVESVSWHHSRF